MSELRRKYCIFGCDALVTYGVPLHRFPRPVNRPDLFAAWIAAVGSKVFSKQSVPLWRQTHSYCGPRRQSGYARPLTDITNLPGLSVQTKHLAGPSRAGPSAGVDSTEFPGPSESTCLTSREEYHARTPLTKFDPETDPGEVDGILMSLDSGSAPGWDGIPNDFLKLARDFVVPLICRLTNLCFKTGIFPTALKRSLITPVHKGGDTNDVNNYRPISVLPSISKILEKILNNRLVNFLNKYNILSSSQYGFRQGLSTQDAVTALTNEIVREVDKGYKCITVFLDLKKAFDTVSVPILVQRLEAIGLRDRALSLFDNYLRGRKQQVKIENILSEEENVIFGVPQGSVLGPPLFLVYINELCNLRDSGGKIFSYADDTAIVFSGQSWEIVRQKAENGLTIIGNWLKANLLTLNVTKTNYICFSPSAKSKPGSDFKIVIRKSMTSSHMNINCQELQRVTSTRYLGIIIDERLSWHAQIDTNISRVRKFIWMFKTLRYVMPPDLLSKIYIALAQSVLTYCIPVWGGASKTKLLELERAQRSLLKVMYFKPYRYPTSSLYSLCGILTVRQLYLLNMTLYLHKSTPYTPADKDKRRNHTVAHSSGVRTAFAKRQYSAQSAYVYNKINAKLKFNPESKHKCKKIITDWLKTLSYEEIEQILIRPY